MLTILLGEYLPGAFPPSAANRTKFGKGLLNDGWRGLSVTTGGVPIILRDRLFSIQPAGAAAPFDLRSLHGAKIKMMNSHFRGPETTATAALRPRPPLKTGLVPRWLSVRCLSLLHVSGILLREKSQSDLGATRGASRSCSMSNLKGHNCERWLGIVLCVCL